MAWRWRAFGAVAGGCCIADATLQVQQGCSSFVLRRARCGDPQHRDAQDDPGHCLLGVKREIAARDGSIVAAVDLVRQQLEENQKARLLLHGPAGAGRGAVVRLVAEGLQNLENRQQQETTNKEEDKRKSEEQEGIKIPCHVYIDCSQERSFSFWATKGWSPRHFLYDMYWLGQLFSGGATVADEMVLDTVRGVDHATLILDKVSCLGLRQDALVQTALEDTSLRVLVNAKVDTVGDVERLYSCNEMIGVRIGDPVSDTAKASRLLALVEVAKTCRPNVYRDKTLEQVSSMYQELTVQRENPREPTWDQESGVEHHLAPDTPESPPKPRKSNDGSLVVSSLPRIPDAAALDNKSESEFEANFYEDLEFVLETSVGWRLDDTISAMQALARTGSIQAAIHMMVDQEATRLEHILRHQVRDDQIAAWLWSVLESLCGTAISMAGIEHAVKSAEGTKMTVLPDLIYVDEITDKPPPEQAPLSWLSHGILETKVSEAGAPLVFVRQLVKKAFDECTHERDAFVSAMDGRIRAVYELQDTYWLGIDLKAYFARRERYEAAMKELSQLEAVSDDENEDIVIESKINLDSERLNLETLRADLLRRCAELYPDSVANQEIPEQVNTIPHHA